MADITRIITVEMTKVFRDAKEGDQEGYGKRVDAVIEGIFGDGFDDIKIAKIQDFVFPDQPKAPKLTKRERAFCELISDGYIARDSDMALWWHESKPYASKSLKAWYSDGKTVEAWYSDGKTVEMECFNEVPFMFITDEAWAVKDLLKLEVEQSLHRKEGDI